MRTLNRSESETWNSTTYIILNFLLSENPLQQSLSWDPATRTSKFNISGSLLIYFSKLDYSDVNVPILLLLFIFI